MQATKQKQVNFDLQRAVASQLQWDPEITSKDIAISATDPEIARDVRHAIQTTVSAPANQVKVSLHNGIVTLEGKVKWNFERAAAGECARSVRGVKGVSNRIELAPSVSSADMRHGIEDALRSGAELDARGVTVWTNEGVVYLYGTVRSQTEKDEAERVAQAAPGVVRVKNTITVIQ